MSALDDIVFILDGHIRDELTKAERRIADVLVLNSLMYWDEDKKDPQGGMAILRTHGGVACRDCIGGHLKRVVEDLEFKVEDKRYVVDSVVRERCDRCGVELIDSENTRRVSNSLTRQGYPFRTHPPRL